MYHHHRPAPPCPPDIAAYRDYMLEEIRVMHEQIKEELKVADPEALAELHEIISQYREVETNVTATIELLRSEIRAFADIAKNPLAVKLELEPVYEPATQNLRFTVKVVR